MLFLKLSTLLSLVSLDSFPLLSWEHLLVLNPELPALKLHVVHSGNNVSRLVRIGEVGKSQTSKDPLIEVVIERVGQRELHIRHKSDELLFLDGEGDVLDDDGSGDQLITLPLGRRRATLDFRNLHHLRVVLRQLAVHLEVVHVL